MGAKDSRPPSLLDYLLTLECFCRSLAGSRTKPKSLSITKPWAGESPAQEAHSSEAGTGLTKMKT